MIRVEVTGAEETSRGIMRLVRRIPRISRRSEERAARSLRDRVVHNARPFRVTGGYERSIQVNKNVVFTDHPAAMRLENGFLGMDSLGRVYAQAPRKHWQPAMDPAREDLIANLLEELNGDQG